MFEAITGEKTSTINCILQILQNQIADKIILSGGSNDIPNQKPDILKQGIIQIPELLNF